MFQALHALAKKHTLMLVITAEDDLLRVNVTPTPADSKVSGLRSLSLVATPEELDADFAQALATWQAPKKSLIEQAQEAASDDDDGKKDQAKPALPAPKSAAPAKDAKPKKAAAAKAPGKKASTKEADATKSSWPLPTGTAAGDEKVAEAGAAPAEAAGTGANEQADGSEVTTPASAPAVATESISLVLDLF